MGSPRKSKKVKGNEVSGINRDWIFSSNHDLGVSARLKTRKVPIVISLAGCF
jgi:hypothetical protein